MARAKTLNIQFYKTERGEYAWRARSANGHEIARSPDGYKRASVALRVLHNMIAKIKKNEYVIHEVQR